MKLNLRNISTGILAMIMAPLMTVSAASAWGPARPTYTMAKPADHATFNSITDNPLVGNERDFVRIVEKGVGNTYTSELTIEPGKQYEVYIYYHNDASETFNDLAHNQTGIAKETRVISDFPDELAKNERQAVIGKITSTTASPQTVWDEAYITAKEAMTLHYVEGSAKLYNKFNQNGTLLSTRLFSSQGTYIGLTELNGIIFGCDQYSGSVTYTIQTVANGTNQPDDNKPDDDKKPDEDDDDDDDGDDDDNDDNGGGGNGDNDDDGGGDDDDDKGSTPEPIVDDDKTPDEPVKPVAPSELPKTGPVEVILAIVVVGVIIAGIAYWNNTHKAVKNATRKAKGKKK